MRPEALAKFNLLYGHPTAILQQSYKSTIQKPGLPFAAPLGENWLRLLLCLVPGQAWPVGNGREWG